MAQVVLGGIGGLIGGGIGRIIGRAVGGALDRSFVASLGPERQIGPRIEALAIQSAGEGQPMVAAFGRARVTGQVIWAARFLERRKESRGGKGGPRMVDYDYSLSFAVALGEGPIDGIGQVWADGQPIDLSGVTMRLYRGTDDQTPDPLIEAVEGQAPAYRGVAYVVFEDMALGPYGDRAPQLAFEVFRRPRGSTLRLEDRLEGVCLIPGAGEFVLATRAVLRQEGLIRSVAENRHHPEGRADLLVSLDQLQAQAPNLKRVSLVIGWFGTDLRAAQFQVKPGVERRDKRTIPLTWSVAGLDRVSAHLVSQVDGAPAYGGTPSDDSVRQAVAELKARGLEVTLYPFVFMDVPEGNGLEDPYGGDEQAAYPWRGRVKGRDGVHAAADSAAAFGMADGWGLRRMTLHYAALAAETGADGLLIGSEMRGLTWTRDETDGFPAVDQLVALACECRAIAGPGVKISYAADWSEYFGRHDGADVRFHLDPLWVDPDVDYVGIDWYPPMGDWRDGDGGLDGGDHSSPDDLDYLAAQVAGGEGFDWFYADDADRAGQVRTPIVDAAHGEDWLFRPKDLKGWWSNAHHDRPGGVRSGAPTAWIPGMKPIRLTEFGCGAVDRGANAPNLFVDPKSAESALPPHSSARRDDQMQRRMLEAVLDHYSAAGNNPVSEVYDGPMLEAADAWCWDARPYPAFPGRTDVWADAASWVTGHWLNGRLRGETADLIEAILERGGISEDAHRIGGIEAPVEGYLISGPMRTRDALRPLAEGLGLIVAERDGRVVILAEEEPTAVLATEALALDEETGAVSAERILAPRPDVARVRFIDGDGYQTGAVTARSDYNGGAGTTQLDLPAVCGEALARAAAQRLLDPAAAETLTLKLGPLEALRLEPGDTVAVEDVEGEWVVAGLTLDETPRAALIRPGALALGEMRPPPRPTEPGPLAGPAFLRVLDLPPLPHAETDGRPVIAAAADPWRPLTIWAGPNAEALTARATVEEPAVVGVTIQTLAAGVRHRWHDGAALTVRFEGGAPESRSSAAVLGGANSLAVETAGGWEVIQFQAATLTGEGTWRLSRLLRGQQGGLAEAIPAGALVVLLTPDLPRAAMVDAERGLPLIWRAAPVGWPPGGEASVQVNATILVEQGRPWAPAHLRARRDAEGLHLDWIARLRLGGDRWEMEAASPDPMRFRVRVLDGGEQVRVWEVEGSAVHYAEADILDDLPGGLTSVDIVVAQWGEGFGWGREARLSL